MTILKVNPTKWKTRDELTHDQINQLDENITNGIDKRAGESDIVESNITVTGTMDFQTDAQLIIEDPDSVIIHNDGDLLINAVIRGDTRLSRSDPLRFGHQSVSITTTSQTLTPAQSNTFVTVLTGALTGDTTVYFPAIEGWTKIIHNKTNQSVDGYGPLYQLTITTPDAVEGGIIMPPSRAMTVYCDGTDLHIGSQSTPNTVRQFQYIADGYNGLQGSVFQSSLSDSVVLHSSTSGNYLMTFNSVVEDDIFEISYRASTRPGTNAGDFGNLVIEVSTDGGSNWLALPETTFANQNMFGTEELFSASFHTIYKALSDEDAYKFRIGVYVGVGDAAMDVFTPINFLIKWIRP